MSIQKQVVIEYTDITSAAQAERFEVLKAKLNSLSWLKITGIYNNFIYVSIISDTYFRDLVLLLHEVQEELKPNISCYDPTPYNYRGPVLSC